MSVRTLVHTGGVPKGPRFQDLSPTEDPRQLDRDSELERMTRYHLIFCLRHA